MAKKGKKYTEALKLVDRSKAYGITEAIELVKKTDFAKFDATPIGAIFCFQYGGRPLDCSWFGCICVYTNPVCCVSYARDCKLHFRRAYNISSKLAESLLSYKEC